MHPTMLQTIPNRCVISFAEPTFKQSIGRHFHFMDHVLWEIKKFGPFFGLAMGLTYYFLGMPERYRIFLRTFFRQRRISHVIALPGLLFRSSLVVSGLASTPRKLWKTSWANWRRSRDLSATSNGSLSSWATWLSGLNTTYFCYIFTAVRWRQSRCDRCTFFSFTPLWSRSSKKK